MARGLFSLIGRWLRLALAAVAILIVVWSFGWVITRPWRAVRERGGRIELTVMHWGNKDESQIIVSLIEDFQRSHPDVRINRINPGGDMYHTKLQTTMAGGCPPDVFYLASDRVASFAGKGQLLNLDPYMAADTAAGQPDLRSDFYGPVLDAFRFDGQSNGQGPIYGLPKDFTTVGFYYNKDLFRRAGVPFPADDWTWDDWLKAGVAIARLDGCYGCELVQWPAMIRSFLWTQGLDVATPDFGRVLADDPGVRAALQRMRDWRFHPPVPRLLTRGVFSGITSSDMFLTGNVGLNGPLGRWMVPTLRGVERFDWDFAPLPHEAGRPPANMVFTTAWAISTRSRHPKEAWELVRHLTGPPGQTLNSRQGLAIPALRSVAESPAFIDPNQKPEHDRAYLDTIPFAHPIDWPPYPEFESLMDAQMSRALNLEAGSIDEGLRELDRAWSAHQSAPLRQTNFPRLPWFSVAVTIGVPALLALIVGTLVWWRRRPCRLEFRDELAGLSMVSPWVIGFAAFTLFPIVLSLLLAFSKWNGIDTLDHTQWVGFANLRQQLFYDERFRHSITATVYYAILAVPLSQLAALGAAILMNHEWTGIRLYRAAWYLPSVLAGVGTAVLWRWVFDQQSGLLNMALTPALAPLGVRPPQWFGNDAPVWAVPAFAVMGLWNIGGAMMIYLAGLKGIPHELKEAAAIDGAGRLGQLRNVTLPLLSPVIFFNVIMAIIGSFQVFVQSYVMTGGGPGDATRFFVLYIYNQAFDFHEMGYASMMAWLLLLIVLTLTALVMRGSRRYVYYEGLKT